MTRGSAAVVPLFVLAFLGITAGLAGAQNLPVPYEDLAAIPDTPAYQRAQELLAVINDHDPEKTIDYVNEAFTPEFRQLVPLKEHARILQQAYIESEGYKLHSARSYDPPRPPTSAVLIVQNRLTESWEAIVVEVEEDPPHRIAAVRVVPARHPTDLPPAERLSDAEIVARLDAFIDRLVDRDRFSGTCLLAKDGEVLLERAAGIANRDFGVPVEIETKFNIGSMNKMLTGVAVAQLAERGKLDFEDPLNTYLGDDWLAASVLQDVTIHHLLTHTSGLHGYFTEAFDRSSRKLFREIEDYQPLIVDDTPAFTPGTDWSYSNSGYMLLGAVIEAASGENYFDYIRRHVTGPAGMTRTDCYELDRVNANLAVGYERVWTPSGSEYRNNIFDHVIRGGPAGGGYSTVRDLLRFARALAEGRLLRPEMLARIWRAYPERNSPEYGYGFGIHETPAGRAVGHSGGFTGINAYLRIYLDAGYTIAALSNETRGAGPVFERACQLIEQGRP